MSYQFQTLLEKFINFNYLDSKLIIDYPDIVKKSRKSVKSYMDRVQKVITQHTENNTTEQIIATEYTNSDDDYVVDFIKTHNFKLFCRGDWHFLQFILDNEKAAYEDAIDVIINIVHENGPSATELLPFYMQSHGFAKFDENMYYMSLTEICIEYTLKEVNMDIFGPYFL